jgi:hypothetical protein
MGINPNKGTILGASIGILVFIITLVIILYAHSDFDQRLIVQVESGVPADDLIPQIDKETEKMKLTAQKHLLNKIDNNFDKNNSMTYIKIYDTEMEMISEYDNARKKFAKREITKEQFLKDIENPKSSMELYQQ